MKTIIVISALLLVTCFAPCAFSDSMSFSGSELTTGTGFGNILNLLTLQQAGGTDFEEGWVIPTSVATGNAANTSKTYTVAELLIAGITADNFGLVFNPNETGVTPTDTLDVQNFFLDFYHAEDLDTPYLSIALTDVPRNIVPISTGQGSQGWAITYDNTGDLSEFFSDSTNILGAHGSIFNTDNGGDDFNIVQLETSTPVPEPTSLLLLGLGLIGMIGARRIAKK